MKKMIMFSALALSMACFAGTSLAAQVSAQDGAGADVVIKITDGKGPGFTASVSPNVLVHVDSIAQAFTIQTMNTVAKAGNRNEYGIWSPYNGYFQRANSDAAITGVTADETESPFKENDNWVVMGGATPSGY